jgi:hypothetical protein
MNLGVNLESFNESIQINNINNILKNIFSSWFSNWVLCKKTDLELEYEKEKK